MKPVEPSVEPKKISRVEATLKAQEDYIRITGRPLNAADRKFFDEALARAVIFEYGPLNVALPTPTPVSTQIIQRAALVYDCPQGQ